jgi:hypothetical protein
MRLGTLIALATATLSATGFAATAVGDGPGFQPLISGEDVRQFILVKIGQGSMTIQGGEVRLSGTPHGYFATRTSYKDYVLRFDWRYERPEGLASDAVFRGNSGVLLHIREPHKVWPECIEVQLMNADAGDTFRIPPAEFQGETDADAQRKAIRSVGEWNAAEVTCRDGSIVVSINGVEVARGTGARPDRGPIGWQSEGAPVRFRNLRIKPLE